LSESAAVASVGMPSLRPHPAEIKMTHCRGGHPRLPSYW